MVIYNNSRFKQKLDLFVLCLSVLILKTALKNNKTMFLLFSPFYLYINFNKSKMLCDIFNK